jgi:pimeloyl-ACP methyl ester carboxylesterase
MLRAARFGHMFLQRDLRTGRAKLIIRSTLRTAPADFTHLLPHQLNVLPQNCPQPIPSSRGPRQARSHCGVERVITHVRPQARTRPSALGEDAAMRHLLRLALCTFTVCAFSGAARGADTTVTGDLPRQADLGFSVSTDDGRLQVVRVTEGSPAARAGLAKDDEILAINDSGRFSKPYLGQAALTKLDGGIPLRLGIRRGQDERAISFTPPPRPFESVPGLDSFYGVVTTTDGTRLRTIVTRPTGASGGPLPVIYFTQWVSCGSLEFSRGGLALEILKTLAQRSGGALIRVERAGTGDSEGPACHEFDYDTEVAHYREALEATFAQYDWLDRNRLVIYGSSLGATVAPLVAQGSKPAGVMVQGGGAVTYLERMINFDRQQLERTGVPAAEIHARMSRQIPFHVEYLLRGRDPDEIAKDSADMAAARTAIRGLGDGEHYGRPYAWHRQAARRNFLEAWTAIDAPVLVLFGEFDQFEGRHGHELIARAVNRAHPGRATFIEIPHMDHEGDVYDTAEDAYVWERQVSGPPNVAAQLQAGPMLRWLRDAVGFPAK